MKLHLKILAIIATYAILELILSAPTVPGPQSHTASKGSSNPPCSLTSDPAPTSSIVETCPHPGCPVGDYGVMQDGINYVYARKEAEIVPATNEQGRSDGTYRITVYGPPRFPTTNHVARWPLTVAECLSIAEDEGLTGICAVSPGTGLYNAVRDDVIPVIEIEGHGTYLVCDRMASWISGGIDIYDPDLTRDRWFREYKTIRRLR